MILLYLAIGSVGVVWATCGFEAWEKQGQMILTIYLLGHVALRLALSW